MQRRRVATSSARATRAVACRAGERHALTPSAAWSTSCCMNEGGIWVFRVVDTAGEQTVGNHTSHELAREAIRRLRGNGDRAFLAYRYPGRERSEFDVDAPTLRAALDLRAFRPPHFTGPNIAAMLQVDLRRIHEALRPLEEGGLIEVTDRGTERETWHLVGPITSLDQLRERATHFGFDLDAPL